MTQNKRFIIPDYPDCILDTVENKEYTMSSYYPHIECICDLLNNLSDENEELHKENQQLRMSPRVDVNEIESLVCENEQLKSEIEKLSYANEDLLEEKRIWKQMSEEYTKLSDENEQLKEEIKDLNDILARYEEKELEE